MTPADRRPTTAPNEPRRPGPCAGGYVLIPALEVAAIWWAYRRGPLRFLDLRVTLAAREIQARRGHGPAGPGRAPRFGLPELARLTGATPRALRGALARLRHVGLLDWAPDRLAFAPGTPAADPEFLSWLDAIPNHRRRVPVPRRILRHLAAARRPVLVAAALGVLFRCLYARGGGLAPRGRIKASWVASTFDVDRRRALAARRDLVALGWIRPEPGDTQAARNRWGAAYVIDLAWAPPRGAGMTPPPAGPGAEMRPPLLPNRDPLTRVGNQDPARGGPSGARRRERGGEGRALPPPDLGSVRPEDLADTGRALELHRQAAARGAVGDGEAGRLRVLAAAEHARAFGSRNPCGLFAAIVSRGLWSHATCGEEERASRRLREHARGGGPSVAVSPGRGPSGVASGTGPGPGLSADAALVRAVRLASGSRGDPYLALRRHSGSWTRSRYERAAAELALAPSGRPGVAGRGGAPGWSRLGEVLARPGATPTTGAGTVPQGRGGPSARG